MNEVTDRQEEVYDWIKWYHKEYRIMPTRREIADAFGFTANAAQTHIVALETKGWIRVLENTSRGIILVEDDG